ncbi:MULTISPECIES: DMT family transporter [unclassified Pseudomonas]|uniref:DMT family transporter n=1 Tax=unclassified Pseudomonas TaxID=196821 RepID=UPI000D3527BF|nr:MULTISPECIES: DMT family transporter [unclassified Pseudomonas]RAU48538.1 DMT family transporter [Pseudomonas sp. RIT 409]RAU54202.1 DMT family transporter [Pseudomonas sp. RIT 412]
MSDAVLDPVGPPPNPAKLTRHSRVGLLFGVLAAVIWGGFLTVSRHGIGEGLRGSDMAFLRYGTAGLLLLPVLLRRSPLTLCGIGWCRSLVLTLLAGPLFVLIGASGYLYAPLAHGAVIQLGVLTLASIALSACFLGERLRASRLVGLVVLVAGLATIAGPAIFSGGSLAWIGDLMFATAGAMFATFTVLIRRWKIAPLDATVVVSVLSAVTYSPSYLLLEGTARIASASPSILVEQVFVQGVLSGIIALFAFAQAVQRLGAGRAALFPALAPAVAILLGIPLIGELPTAGQWLGLGIASTGLLIALVTPAEAFSSPPPVDAAGVAAVISPKSHS